MSVIAWLYTRRPTRLRAYASATALPRSPQASLPAWVGWPLTGRGSHPLDDTQGFMTCSSIPLDRPAWPHHATTPRSTQNPYLSVTLDTSHSSSFDQRRRPETFFTAMAAAFFWPTSTTSRLPRVMPV